ncbi:MAG: hypothetical protein HS111_28570 [Kofleriaceae bacterium]|nr:hypothetical protein [Kofleriaceae bacterium]MCL4223597.1 hypothetical protein [Myxococcales bacterium]
MIRSLPIVTTRRAGAPPAVLVALAAAALAAGCDDKTVGKVKEVGKQVDQAADKLDRDEAAGHLAAARAALQARGEPAEACSWAASAAADQAAASAQSAVAELRRLCSLDVPLGRATRAVSQAEAARAEQLEAPSLTECASDEWARAASALDRDHGGEPRWAELKRRWAAVCPP